MPLVPIWIITTVQVKDAVADRRLGHDKRWPDNKALVGERERGILTKAIITVRIKTVISDQVAALGLPRCWEP